MVISKKTIIFQGFSGVPTFSKVGCNFFQGRGGGGPNAYFHRNRYNVIFQEGPDPLSPPLDPRMIGLG